MRKTLKIAFRELSTLFHSPVAWILLAVFILQASTLFTGLLKIMIMQQFSRPLWYSIASGIFTDSTGILLPLHARLYLYIPLLTMGLISRERSTGTIQLLYSSPVTTFQIIVGKYLSVSIYGLVLIAILPLFLLILSLLAPDLDVGIALAGILATYLLVLTYAAIGLYLSSLTTYRVVAAIGTLAALAFLDQVGTIGQDTDILRDVTHWLSLRGRAEVMVSGLIRGQDIAYFILVILLACSLAALQVDAGKRRDASLLKPVLRHVAVIVAFLAAGYITSLPALATYHDATADKAVTLAPASQEIIRELPDDITITTYVNLLDQNFLQGMPKNRNSDKELFARYTRFKPHTRFLYTYYYADPILPGQVPPTGPARQRALQRAADLEIDFTPFLPLDSIEKYVDLAPEGYRFARVIQSGDKKTLLRLHDDSQKHPGEQQISAAFKTLLREPARIHFLAGHGERSPNKIGDADYHSIANSRGFRYSLVNNGFLTSTIQQQMPPPSDILLIASPSLPIPPSEVEAIRQYIRDGGNLFLLVDPDTRQNLLPVLQTIGVNPLPHPVLVATGNHAPSIVPCVVTPATANLGAAFKSIAQRQRNIVMKETLSIPVDTIPGYTLTPILQTKEEHPRVTMIALQNNANNQRIVIAGDADHISNAEIQAQRPGMPADNRLLFSAVLRWLTNDQYPVAVTRPLPKDTRLQLDNQQLQRLQPLLTIVLPLLPLVVAALTLARRKKK